MGCLSNGLLSGHKCMSGFIISRGDNRSSACLLVCVRDYSNVFDYLEPFIAIVPSWCHTYRWRGKSWTRVEDKLVGCVQCNARLLLRSLWWPARTTPIARSACDGEGMVPIRQPVDLVAHVRRFGSAFDQPFPSTTDVPFYSKLR